MKKSKNPGRGGAYYKASPDAEAIFMGGTDRPVTEQEKKALEAAKRSAKPTTKPAEKEQAGNDGDSNK